ncbi:hypothetical protein HN51_043182 [Arachis hypogaea]
MRNSDELNFSVGFASALFPLDNFFVSPRCSCRLNCNDEDNDEFRVRKLKLRISCRQACIENTRMDRRAFHALCNMLRGIGRLKPSRNMGVEEMAAMFLHIIAHDVKIRVIKRQFVRSEEIISRHFNDVLLAILRCHNLFLKKSQPFSQDRMDE